jgi:hypothetical protein
MSVIFASAPVTIGKHQWRVTVTGRAKDHPLGSAGMAFEWRRSDFHEWQPDRAWPSYNSDDGTYAGLPRSLAKRLPWRTAQAAQALATADDPVPAWRRCPQPQ